MHYFSIEQSGIYKQRSCLVYSACCRQQTKKIKKNIEVWTTFDLEKRYKTNKDLGAGINQNRKYHKDGETKATERNKLPGLYME